MTGRELYEINAEQRELLGLLPMPPWEQLHWREQQRFEDMAVEVAAADREDAD